MTPPTAPSVSSERIFPDLAQVGVIPFIQHVGAVGGLYPVEVLIQHRQLLLQLPMHAASGHFLVHWGVMQQIQFLLHRATAHPLFLQLNPIRRRLSTRSSDSLFAFDQDGFGNTHLAEVVQQRRIAYFADVFRGEHQIA